MSPKAFVANLSEHVKRTYIGGCYSMPFAEDVKRLRPDLNVFGISVAKKIYESPMGGGHPVRLQDVQTKELSPLKLEQVKT